MKKSSVVKLVVRALQRSLSVGRRRVEQGGDIRAVPEDVKEGYFAVLAVRGEKPRRFVVSLSYLSHPAFLRLLEMAAEEFCFDQEGTLAIPCRPSELERIIGES